MSGGPGARYTAAMLGKVLVLAPLATLAYVALVAGAVGRSGLPAKVAALAFATAWTAAIARMLGAPAAGTVAAALGTLALGALALGRGVRTAKRR
jgi:hypothetical protein